MNYSRSKPRILFLYTELAGYFISCLNKLNELYDVEIFVIHWPVNKEAPFQFKLNEQFHFFDKNQFSKHGLKEKVVSISPDFIYSSGWMDKDYLAIAKEFRKKIPVVIGLDNQWTGSLKQRIACLVSRFTILRTFNYCWVPGEKQKKYALNLGFPSDKVLEDYYSADVDYFLKLGDNSLPSKRVKYPHRFIFAGRYYKFKGITDLWNAFITWQKEEPGDWELWCVGTGTEVPVIHPKIKHLGFIQPENFAPVINEGGAFIMPSHFEPWGVVLHEFAAAGFPLIVSDAVGSSEAFIKFGENGFIFKAGDKEDLINQFQNISIKTDKELLKMGELSREKALNVTPEKWAKTLMKTIKLN